MRIHILFPALFASLTWSANAAPTSCEAYVRSRDPGVGLLEHDVCYCGSQLANLTVTVPPGLRVEAVCALRISGAAESRPVDLTREQVSLDSYTDGGYPQGLIYLSGTMESPLVGTVHAEEEAAGALWFGSKVDRRGPVFQEYHLRELQLGSDEDYEKLGAPRPDALQGECREAEATLSIRDPVVLLGETDEAGTSADFDVVGISAFRPCVTIENPQDTVRKLIKGQPADVVALITRIAGCRYWQGEWPYADEGRKTQIAAELAKLDCPSVADADTRARDRYIGNAGILEAIDAAKAIEY
jgi:hypothetical protein